MGLLKNDSCIFVTLDDSRKDKLLIFVDKVFQRRKEDFCLPLWKARYLQHNAAVRAIVPQDQLLVHKVLKIFSGQPWQQLLVHKGERFFDNHGSHPHLLRLERAGIVCAVS